MSEADEPIGARHQQDQHDPQPDRRRVGQQEQQPPHQHGQHEKIARTQRSEKPPVPERRGQLHQGHLGKSGIEQCPQGRPNQHLQRLPGGGGARSQREADANGQHVDPHLVAFQLLPHVRGSPPREPEILGKAWYGINQLPEAAIAQTMYFLYILKP